MPRRTRTQVLRAHREDEERARRDREEAYWRLEIALHRAWRDSLNTVATVTTLVPVDVRPVKHHSLDKVRSDAL